MTTSNEPLIIRQAVKIQVPLDYVQITIENQRCVARWCGGMVTDELVYSEPVDGYIVPNSDDAWYLAVMVPGVVIRTSSGPLVARVSDYVLKIGDELNIVSAETFARDYRDVFKRVESSG